MNRQMQTSKLSQLAKDGGWTGIAMRMRLRNMTGAAHMDYHHNILHSSSAA